jgi:uncharacterized protein
VSSPFVVATAELFRHRGMRSPLHRRGPLPGVALSTSRLAEGRDIDVDLVLEAQGDTVIATGTVTALWEGECRRCLTETGGELAVDLQEVFEPDPVEGETYPLARDHVDLTPALREALALALPVAPLCSEDCAGPDPDDHPVTVEPDEADPGDAGDDAAPADPRWAALDELRFDG